MNKLDEKEIRKAILAIKQKRIAEEKKKFNAAKKARKTSSIPMAEEVDLKSIQCQFESDLEDK